MNGYALDDLLRVQEDYTNPNLSDVSKESQAQLHNYEKVINHGAIYRRSSVRQPVVQINREVSAILLSLRYTASQPSISELFSNYLVAHFLVVLKTKRPN